MSSNTAYNQESALTKADIYSPGLKRAIDDFSGERYISNVLKSLDKSFCMVSREPETGCLQEKRIP